MRVRLFLLAVFRVILETLSPQQIGHRIPSGQRIVSRNSSASSSVLNVLVTSMRFIYLPRYKASINQSQLCVKGIIVDILDVVVSQNREKYRTFGHGTAADGKRGISWRRLVVKSAEVVEVNIVAVGARIDRLGTGQIGTQRMGGAAEIKR